MCKLLCQKFKEQTQGNRILISIFYVLCQNMGNMHSSLVNQNALFAHAYYYLPLIIIIYGQ